EFQVERMPLGEVTAHVGNVALRMTEMLDFAEYAVDQEVEGSMIPELLRPHSILNGGATIAAKRLNVRKDKLSITSVLLAASSFILWLAWMRFSLQRLLSEVKQHGGRSVSLFYRYRYDESPFKVVVVDSPELSNEFLVDAVGRGDDVPSLIDAVPVRDAAPSKLLCIEITIGAHVEIGGNHRLVTWTPPMPYLSLPGTTSTCYFNASSMLHEALGLKSFEEEFESVQRVSCTDGDGACARAERAWSIDSVTDALHQVDRIHRIMKYRESVVELSGLEKKVKHCALSMRFGNFMANFRHCVRVVSLRAVRICRDRPVPYSGRLKLAKALDVLLPKRMAGNVQRRWVIESMGLVWQDGTTHLHVYVPAGGPSDTDIKLRLIREFTHALVHSGPQSFPGRNFVKAEQTPNWIALLEVFGVFTRAYPMWADMVGGKKHVPSVRDPLPALLRGLEPDLAAIADAPAADDDAHVADGVADDEPSRQELNVERVRAKDEQQAKKLEQAMYRANTLKWIRSSCVYFDMFNLSVGLLPHIELMAKHMYICGKDWDVKQASDEVAAVKAALQPGGGAACRPDGTLVRTFRSLEPFQGRAEQAVLEQSRRLMGDAATWDVLPFRARCLASLIKDDTLDREHAHQRFRRYACVRSVQTRPIELSKGNAYWVGLQQADQERRERREQLRRKLSAWNAFFVEASARDRAQGRRRTVQELSQEYAGLSEEARTRLNEIAERANVAVDAGAERPLVHLGYLAAARAVGPVGVGGEGQAHQLAVLSADWGRIEVWRQSARREMAAASQRACEDAAARRDHHVVGHGREQLARLADQLPAWASAAQGNVMPEPSLSHSFAHYHAAFDARPLASKLASVRTKGRAARPVAHLKGDILKCWAHLNRTILDPKVEKVTEAEPPKPVDTVCFRANDCMCGEGGQSRSLIKSRLETVVKQSFKLPVQKRLLHTCNVFAIFVGDLPDRSPDAAPGAASRVHCMVVGDLLLKPFDIFWGAIGGRNVDLASFIARDADSPSMHAAVDVAIPLQYQYEGYLSWDVVKLLDLSMKWEVAFFEAHFSGVTGAFRPCCASAVQRGDRRLHLLWDPLRKRKKRQRLHSELSDWLAIADADDELYGEGAAGKADKGGAKHGDDDYDGDLGADGGSAGAEGSSVEDYSDRGVPESSSSSSSSSRWGSSSSSSDGSDGREPEGPGGDCDAPDVDPDDPPHRDPPGYRADGHGGPVGAAGDWVRIDVPGGHLMWSRNHSKLDAHCGVHGKSCKCDRTYRSGQRPLGRQLAWLEMVHVEGVAVDQDTHSRELKDLVGTRDYYGVRQWCRSKFEEFADGNPIAKALVEHESPEGPGQEPQ
ncbi:unnamed protein product, partial [Prorocentrum cordatum]